MEARLFLVTARQERGEPSLTRALTNSIHRLGLSQDLWLSTDGVCYHHERFNCFCGRPSSDRCAAQVDLCVIRTRTRHETIGFPLTNVTNCNLFPLVNRRSRIKTTFWHEPRRAGGKPPSGENTNPLVAPS